MPRKRLTDEEYRARYGRVKPGPRRPEAKARIAEANRARIAAGRMLTPEQRRRGGRTTAERYGPEYMAAISRLGASQQEIRRLEAELAQMEADAETADDPPGESA